MVERGRKSGMVGHGLIGLLYLNGLFQMQAEDPHDDFATGWNAIRADMNSVTVGFDFAVPPEMHFFAIE